MSGKVSGLVWELDIPHEHAWLLMSLADHAEHDGTSVRPGGSLTAWKTGYSVRHVKRLTADLLQKYDLLEVVSPGGGAYPAEYRIKIESFDKWQKPPRKSRGRPQKDADKTHDTGDMGEEKPMTQNEKPMTPTRARVETSIETSTTTKAREEKEEPTAVLDDATGKALTILKRVEGFPRKQAENAIYLTELREEFPDVDTVEVCRQYEIWTKDNGKSKNPRGRLRNFFKKAQSEAQEGAQVVQFPSAVPSGEGSPEVLVEVLANYDRGGDQSLRRLAPIARRWDFTSQDEMPWRIQAQISRDEEERKLLLRRVGSLWVRIQRGEFGEATVG